MTDSIPFGSWPSPLTAAEVSAASPRIDGARYVGDEIWWGEGVPDEGGRTTVRRCAADGTVHEVLPNPWSARSRVNEYGGGSWTATDAGDLLFVEKTDQRIWSLSPDRTPTPLTPGDGRMRFGGLSAQYGRVLAIRETDAEGTTPLRDIVSIALDGAGITSLVGGSDFLAHPALSPDGTMLAWIAWNHPDMPWDRSELRVGRIHDGTVSEWEVIAGAGSSPVQPVWADASSLVFADDVSGRWNLWRRRVDADAKPIAPAEPIAPAQADTGGPVWVLGSRWFALLEDDTIVAVRTQGDDALVRLDAQGAHVLPVPPVSELLIEDASGSRVLISGAPADAPAGLWEIDLAGAADVRTVRGGTSPWGPEWLPSARPVVVDGPRGPVHAFDFPRPTRRPTRRTASFRPTSCTCTGGRRRIAAARHPLGSPTSPAAASASSMSITADPAGTAGPTASVFAVSGASSTSKTSPPPPPGSPPKVLPIRRG